MTPDATPPRLVGRRDVLRTALSAAAALLAAACAAPAAPSWTFAPAGTGRIPSAGSGAAATANATATATQAGDPLLVRLVAENFAFDLPEFSVPAGTPFRIEFDHRDAKIPHNVAVYDSGPKGALLFRGEIVIGPIVVTYHVPGLPPGTHYFQCDPHPPMNGLVRVA